jgi:hypothetical protein
MFNIVALVSLSLTTLVQSAASESKGALTDFMKGNGNFSSLNVEGKWKNTNEEEFKVAIIESGNDKVPSSLN